MNRCKVDYIVEEGSNSEWTWTKWNSGRLEMHGHKNTTQSHYTTVNGFYGFYTDISFPVRPKDIYSVITFQPQVSNSFSIPSSILNRSVNGARIYALSNVYNTQTIYWNYSVIGFCK